MYYPKHPVWKYSRYLGEYSIDGKNYDLGVYMGREPSLAIVYGQEPHQYISGEISLYIKYRNKRPVIVETIRRAKEKGLI